jgi:vacuolar protein-sorting-associated protein 4
MPCSPSDEGAFRMTLSELTEPEKLMPPEVSIDDFIKALSKIKPTVAAIDLIKQEQFTKEFGQEG